MRSILLIACLLGAAQTVEQPPKTMTKVEVVLGSPDVPPGSFATKPKVVYRAGERYCRIEEAPDPDHGIHGLIIIHEPDFWMVNLATGTARHGVDPGPTFNCRLPIFPDGASEAADEESKVVRQLEFGLELEFFKGRGVIAEKGPVLQTKETMVYRTVIGATKLGLFTWGTPNTLLPWCEAAEASQISYGTAAMENCRLMPHSSRNQRTSKLKNQGPEPRLQVLRRAAT